MSLRLLSCQRTFTMNSHTVRSVGIGDTFMFSQERGVSHFLSHTLNLLQESDKRNETKQIANRQLQSKCCNRICVDTEPCYERLPFIGFWNEHTAGISAKLFQGEPAGHISYPLEKRYLGRNSSPGWVHIISCIKQCSTAACKDSI